MYKGIDCASRLTATSAAKAKAAGFSFAGRYLVPETYGKALTKAEAEAITAAGLRLLTVYETTADRALGGWDAGAYDGLAAKKCADAINMPPDGIIYFAVDFDAQEKDMPKLAKYFDGAFASAGGYRIGVYGSYRVIETMKQHGVCDGFWQCVAWSYGKHSPNRTVYQSDWSGTVAAKSAASTIGVPVDLNECVDMDAAGLWTYPQYREPEQPKTENNPTDAEILRLLKSMTPLQAYEVLKKAQEHAATLPVPEWAESEYEEAKEAGITDGTRPLGFVTRVEAALMAWRAKR